MPELDPDVSDEAPISDQLTDYDREHLVTYLRMLDADAAQAEPEVVMRIVLHINPTREPERAWRAYRSHLARAKWITRIGYALLLKDNVAD
jgi:hypothetical protein